MSRKILGGEHIGSTIGLKCSKDDKSSLVRIQFHKNFEGTVSLQPVNGHNLQEICEPTNISWDEFGDRPFDAYDDTKEATWAMRKCGFHVCGTDDMEDRDHEQY